MSYDETGGEGSGAWYYDCRCGDVFELTRAHWAAGIDLLECQSCSLAIRPVAT